MPDKTKYTPDTQNGKTPSPVTSDKPRAQEGAKTSAEEYRPYPEYKRQRRIEDWFPN